MKKFLNVMLPALIFATFVSCGTSIMAAQRDPGKFLSKSIKKSTTTNDKLRYKRMKECEEKFLKRFNRVYAKQKRKVEAPDISTPFFSSNSDYKH